MEPWQALMAAQRRGMGLAWKPRKTRITPPLNGADGMAGFDCLGCHLRQYPTQSKRGDNTSIKPSRRARAQHQRPIAERVRRHRLEGQARVMAVLNPMIRGWSHDCSTVCSQETFAPMDDAWRQQWRAWIRVRHPHKHRKWGQQRYWRREDGRRHCIPRGRGRW
jgi:RNA-directed DNA polymerase